MSNSQPARHINKFLVVDDQRSVRAFVRALLAVFEAEITEAGNGDDALRLIQEQQFDVVFLDINMPGTSGLEVCERVRKELGFDNLPVVIMTSMESRDLIEKSFDAGATDYINKTYIQYEMIHRTRAILERRKSERELYLAKKEAELANSAKDSFLATMSHEIRTPLTGMLGMLELLSLTQLDNEQRPTLDAAWNSGRGLLRIVSDILDWSKIKEGKLELSPRPTSIAQLLQEVVNTYSSLVSAKSLILFQHTDARLNSAHIVDPLRLSQVLNNFVSNAIKFTQYGEIELRAELLDQLDSAERIRFSVKDSGCGIAKDIQERLFQRYQQESSDTARIYGGTGLGLSICQCLAEIMDGVIELKSEQGLGSIFSIVLTLPVTSAPVETMRNLHPEVEQRAVRPLFTDSMDAPLVLAVDDHPTNRNLLARQLKILGLRAETAENGQAALSLWRGGHFALVITDCHMPEMDGYTLSRAIRKIEAEEARPRTPIIAWTANALANESGCCHAADMDDLLVKPADMMQLRKMLAKYLSISEADSSQPASSQHAANSGQASAPIDYSLLNMMVTNNTEQIQLLQDFQSHIRADHARLLEMLGLDDPANVEDTAHRMKGSCQMVGAMYMANACEVIEKTARNGDMAGARAAKVELDKAIRQLETYFAETGVSISPQCRGFTIAGSSRKHYRNRRKSTAIPIMG